MLLLTLVLFAASSSFALVNPRGSDETHDIATWNLETFPLNEGLTVNYLTVLIQDLELDVIALQEIGSMEDFDQLVSNLNGWDGYYSPDFVPNGTQYMKTAIIWNTQSAEVGDYTQLWPGAQFAFPRPPIQAPVTMFTNGDTLRFNMIVMHLTAGEDLDRRRAAADSLHAYITRESATGNDRWVVIGDWNDTLDDSPNYNAFNVFLNEPQDWIFLNEDYVGDPGWGSHILGDRLIDHIMVTPPVMSDYMGGDTDVMRLDIEWNDDLYLENISDHRPVGSYFPGATNDVAGGTVSEMPADGSMRIWPVPSNGTVRVSYELPVPGMATLSVFDMLGRRVTTLPMLPGQTQATWQAGSAPSGIYFLQLQGADGLNMTRRAVIVK
jgi:exonuclease III